MTVSNFEDYLSEACDKAEVGFYFEEGGCIAMALEIKAALEDDGHMAEIAVDHKACHVYAVADGMMFDHQGSRRLSEIDFIGQEELMVLAKAWAVYDALDPDRIVAREIIQNAKEIAAEATMRVSTPTLAF